MYICVSNLMINMMKKIVNIALLAVVLFGSVSCYSEFDNPAKMHEYSDEDFSASQVVSIAELRTKYSALVNGLTASEVITDDLVIRGKVISSDKDGNVYKSLYILDHSGDKSSAIEIRLYASNYVKYPAGTMVYVRLKGLSIGNYRGMLSIGYPKSEASNPAYPNYKHTNIEGRLILKDHVFIGEHQAMEKRDTLVVTKDNYTTVLNNDCLARLVRFEGLESAYGKSAWGYKNEFPSYFTTVEDQFVWNAEVATEVEALAEPTFAFYGQNPDMKYDNKASLRYYGSSWYTYNRAGTDNLHGQYVIRASAYARFREQVLPADGAKVNITAIYGRYTNSSNYEPNTAYQITPSKGSDIVVVE